MATGRNGMTKNRVLRFFWWALVVTAAIGLISATFTFREMQNPLLLLPVAAETVVGASVARQRPGNPMGWVFLGIGALAGFLSLAVGLTALGARVTGELPWWAIIAAWVASWGSGPAGVPADDADAAVVPLWPVLHPVATSAVAIHTLCCRDDDGCHAGPDHWGGVLVGRGGHSLSVKPPVATIHGKCRQHRGFACGWVLRPAVPRGVGGIHALIGLACQAVARGRTRTDAVVRIRRRPDRPACRDRSDRRTYPPTGSCVAGRDAGPLLLRRVVWRGIFRYRLYDIDRIISRSTSYALVTALVVVVYLGVVTAASTVIPVSDTLPVALATLVAAAVFRPALRWTQARVDQRFDRTRYNAEQTVQLFAHRLRDDVNPETVSEDLLAVLDRTMQPSVSGLWLRDR